MRRAPRIARSLRTALVALTAGGLSALGCGGERANSPPPAAEPLESASSASPPPISEAERTRAMEAKQEEMNRKYQEAKAGAMTPEEIEQAYREYERDQQELNQMADSAAPPPADETAADYPPPPR